MLYHLCLDALGFLLCLGDHTCACLLGCRLTVPHDLLCFPASIGQGFLTGRGRCALCFLDQVRSLALGLIPDLDRFSFNIQYVSYDFLVHVFLLHSLSRRVSFFVFP
jgi:hypothetical protein